MTRNTETQRLEDAIRYSRELRANAADFIAAAKHEAEDLETSLRERLMLPPPNERTRAT